MTAGRGCVFVASDSLERRRWYGKHVRSHATHHTIAIEAIVKGPAMIEIGHSLKSEDVLLDHIAL
jgi:hypothetical protein